MKTYLRHFLTFGIQQALSCLFPVMVFTMLALSHLFTAILPRYDFMLMTCLAIQFILFFSKIETKDEVLVICIFHLLGLCMELFKVHVGSWSYPEFAYTKFFGVPLYSGFMYASVASYMCQAWRRFDLQMLNWPPHWPVRIAGLLIYLNFFTNHFIHDMRYLIGIFVLILFRKSVVVFHVDRKAYRMPVALSFVLIGFFIWLAENIATRFGAWKYAYQHKTWAMVDYQKISSWAFLVVVSYIIVAELKMLKEVIEEKPVV
ncbi:DUF817 domain-containing protein [Mucilaginibacter lacusdianchii]|uniref:DUF817 domain-containing protein n=1 Tax=Mucilaginibacter lacusdianchii TaxID=2684211 RepID=UPI00131D7C1E|nr:DUF817 domain-containing protein [Mucilaginibacter sp. JXJ CY 39]